VLTILLGMQVWVSSMNRGAQKLRDRLEERGEKKKFAEWLGVDQPMVSHWLSGERKPTPQQRASIEDEYGIGWRTWDDESDSAKGAA